MDAHLQRLLDELGMRARAEIDQVSAAAQARADGVAAASATRIAERRAAAIAECDDEVRRGRNGAVAAARHDGRRVLLEAQHAFVDRVLHAARDATDQRLATCVDAERLVSRSRELLSYMGTDAIELRCRPPIAAQIGPCLTAGPVTVVADDDAPWGLTIVAADGRLTIDDTVEAWLASERAAIAIDVCHSMENES